MPHWICQCSVHCKPIRFKLDVITCTCSHGGGTCTVWPFRYYRFTYGHFHHIALINIIMHSKSTSPIQSLYQTLRFVQGVRLRQYVGSLNTAREKVKDRTAWLPGLTGQRKDPRAWFEFCSCIMWIPVHIILWAMIIHTCLWSEQQLSCIFADMHKIVWAIKDHYISLTYCGIVAAPGGNDELLLVLLQSAEANYP